MGCAICRELEHAFESILSEYIQARSSVCYRVSTELAAQKNVDMERARYELEEHRRVCALAGVPVHLPDRVFPDRTAPAPFRQLAA